MKKFRYNSFAFAFFAFKLFILPSILIWILSL